MTVKSTHIIIVNYNAGDWLYKAVKSALRFSNGQVSVIDNASSDDSVSKVQERIKDERLEWLLNVENRGFAAANNQVLENLTADYAVLMNPDCELEANTLAPILEAFEENPVMGLASCRILNNDGSLQITCRRRFPTPWSAMVRLLHLHRLFPNNTRFANFDYGDTINAGNKLEFVEAVSGAFMVVRKKALDQVGLLDEAYFMHCEDLDWCKRFELSGWKIGFLTSPQVIHAKGVSTMSRPVKVLWTLHTGMNRFFDKFYKDRYSWPLRYAVKIGIVVSFFMRAILVIVKRVFQ